MSKMLVRALILVTVALASVACGSTKRAAKPAAAPPPPAAPVRACKLTSAQRHAVALAMADIHRLKVIQAPLHKFSDMGTPAQETVTGKFLMDMGSAGKLPINLRGRLIDLAKSSVGLCGQCFQGLEAEEPAVSGGHFGGETRCG
jgi:hypothetical protein